MRRLCYGVTIDEHHVDITSPFLKKTNTVQDYHRDKPPERSIFPNLQY